jgi:cytochrome c553
MPVTQGEIVVSTADLHRGRTVIQRDVVACTAKRVIKQNTGVIQNQISGKAKIRNEITCCTGCHNKSSTKAVFQKSISTNAKKDPRLNMRVLSLRNTNVRKSSAA